MEYNKAKCQVLHLAWAIPSTKRLGRKWIESSLGEELGVLVDKKLDMSWKHAFEVQKTRWAASREEWLAG